MGNHPSQQQSPSVASRSISVELNRERRAEPLRRAAWSVLALVFAGLLALSAQALRHDRSLPTDAAVDPPRLATVTPAPLPVPVDASAELPAPGSGTTGTIALPALPTAALALTPADPTSANWGVVAARPFAFGRAGTTDRVRALECLTAAIYYEAASEPDAGQAAVAQVVLNRVRHPAFPASVCGVVYQGSERSGCQFSFACDGSLLRHQPSAGGWARAARAAAVALGGHVYAPVGLATHYHTFAVTPAWNRSLVMTAAVGAHFFHRWKGWWGTAAAFHQIYAGGEPLPGPHAPLIAPPAILALAAPVLPSPVTPLATIQPAYRASGAALAVAPSDDHLPAASTILPRWRDSGAPLR